MKCVSPFSVVRGSNTLFPNDFGEDLFTRFLHSVHTHTHTIVLLLFWNLSGTTRVSRYQKGYHFLNAIIVVRHTDPLMLHFYDGIEICILLSSSLSLLTVSITECKRSSNWPVTYPMCLSVSLSVRKYTVAKWLIRSGCRFGWWVGSVEDGYIRWEWWLSKGKGQFWGWILGILFLRSCAKVHELIESVEGLVC